jgi:hypothetical protein
VRVLFLAGIGRSGTTLVERTLGELPGVVALGEVMHLWDRGLVRRELCGCGAPLVECPFWTAVGERAFGGWDAVDTRRLGHLKSRVDRAVRVPGLALGLPTRLAAEAREYTDHFVRVYRAAAELGGPLVVDSSKQVSLAWCLSRSPDVDLRVVHCVRDSRGVAHSWSRDVLRPEAVSEEHRRMPRYSPWTVSALWWLHNLEIEGLRARVPVAPLRYEDFVREPAPALAPALAVAGLPAAPLPHVTGDAVRLSTGHSCAGNPMRFRCGEVALVPDDRWRREQAPRHRRLVTGLTAPLLSRYRYPLGGPA